YAHEHAAQDEVLITTRYNVAPKLSPEPAEVKEDVASALGRYTAVADDLWALLSGFADGSGTPATLTNAAQSFATLTSQVAAACGKPPLGHARRRASPERT